MIRARIAPLSPSFVTRARSENVDDLGQPVRRMRAKGGEPIRNLLRRAQPGEELILASFSPFSQSGPFREFGPVYISAEDAGAPLPLEVLQTGGDDDYLRRQFVIRAYSPNEEIVDAALVTSDEAQEVVDRFFARDDTAFLHVRFPTYGCFACRLDRP